MLSSIHTYMFTSYSFYYDYNNLEGWYNNNNYNPNLKMFPIVSIYIKWLDIGI